MKFCQPHWDALRAAIDARGLTKLVAKDGLAAAARMAREAEGTGGPDDFDPLMSSHFAIINNAMNIVTENAGPRAALSFMGADICPLCELNSLHLRDCQEAECSFSYDNWIERAADDAKAYAEAHLLTGEAGR